MAGGIDPVVTTVLGGMCSDAGVWYLIRASSRTVVAAIAVLPCMICLLDKDSDGMGCASSLQWGMECRHCTTAPRGPCMHAWMRGQSLCQSPFSMGY